MKPVTLKPIEIGYGKDKIVIFPRMISVAEQEDVQSKFTDIADTDTEKYQKEFEICRNAIDEFSERTVCRLEKDKGEYQHLVIEGGATAHFADRTTENERVVREAYQLMLGQMRPESRFL